MKQCLIVDSGSTKCRWITITAGGVESSDTPGFNPALLSDSAIAATFRAGVPQRCRATGYDQVWIYAAGCRSAREESALTASALALWPGAEVHSASDMLGAARAVCGHEPGIACILGTGSNCALYTPSQGIVASTPPLGYVLGDEGSGADIGKAIVNRVLKRLWSKELCNRFMSDTALSQDSIIEKVYRSPEPNRFLASLTRWAATNISSPEVEALVTERFRAFIRHNIRPLSPAPELCAGFVGSVAAVFERQLREAAAGESLAISCVEASPEPLLIRFHSSL